MHTQGRSDGQTLAGITCVRDESVDPARIGTGIVYYLPSIGVMFGLLVLWQVGVVALGVGALLLASPRESKLADRSVMLVITAYVLVMGWNFGILFQAAGPHVPLR